MKEREVLTDVSITQAGERVDDNKQNAGGPV
jgi:hypothetical protein